MKPFATGKYWYLLQSLPDDIRELAHKNYTLLRENPQHPSLGLKRVGPLWSVRIGIHYRALGRDTAEGILWFWIGPTQNMIAF